MDDRGATNLQWLIETVEDCPDVLDMDALDKWVVSEVFEVESISTSLTEDLAWELAVGAITNWDESTFSRVRALEELQQVTLLRLTAALAKDAELNNSAWLTLAAYAFCSTRVPRLAQDDLSALIEDLSDYSPQMSSPLANINDTLACLDSIIVTVDEARREQAAAIAICVVVVWTHSGVSYPALGSDIGAPTIMADWVKRRAQEVIKSRTASGALRFTVHQAAYSSFGQKVLSEEFRSERLAVSEVPSQFERRTSAISDLQLSDPVQESTALNIAILRADRSVENGNPMDALDHLSWADERYSTKHQDLNLTKSLVRASARAVLGDLQLAIDELELILSRPGPHDDRWSAGVFWAYGRLMYEKGDKSGLSYLQRAVDLAKTFSFPNVYVRMSLLLAEKETEKGDPANALQRIQSVSHVEDPRFSIHARVVEAEARLALGRSDSKQGNEHLDTAYQILNQLVEDGILDTPERIVSRALAALGELQLVWGNDAVARSYLREALSALDEDPSITWISPDTAPQKYWRRPWSRNWRRVAELALIAELVADEPDMSSAFAQLQRYRTLTHKGTIAELAGFTSEWSLSAGHWEALGELRNNRDQMQDQIKSLRAEATRVGEAIGSSSTPTPGPVNLWRRKEEIDEQLAVKKSALQRAEEDVRRIEQEAYETRGHLAGTAEIRRPDMSEIKRHLARNNAAVVELVRLDGSELGLPIRWWTFIVTAKGVEGLVELPREDIDELLLSILDDRTQLTNWSLGKLSDLIIRRLPRLAGRFHQVFVASDGEAWRIPFRSLIRPRWWFVPWKLTDSGGLRQLGNSKVGERVD